MVHSRDYDVQRVFERFLLEPATSRCEGTVESPSSQFVWVWVVRVELRERHDAASSLAEFLVASERVARRATRNTVRGASAQVSYTVRFAIRREVVASEM